MSVSPEFLGYAASMIVIGSLLMSSPIPFRVVNLAGALSFTAYGVIIEATPVIAMNVMIAVVDVAHLWRIRQTVAVPLDERELPAHARP